MSFFILLFVKLVTLIIKLLGKKGGSLPGKLALMLNKNIYNYFKISGKIIVITGTNGKTTTTNMIYQILSKNNKVISNIEGNNIGPSILSTLINNSSITGKIKCDYLVLETDELWVPKIYQYDNLKIDTLIVLDFFRDQLDRSGEIESLILKLDTFIKNNPCNLILNGNDPNVVRLGINNTGKNYYYGVDKLNTSKSKSRDKMDGIICPNCKKMLKYDFYQYAHIGKFTCKKCSFGEFNFDILVTNIEGNKIYIDKEQYEVNKDDLYNIYNILSIITLSKIYKINKSNIKNVIKNYKSLNGRGQEFIINGNKVILNLAKNSTGFNVVFKKIKEDTSKKDLLIIINDTISDGCDVSWLWDVDFNNIESFDQIICSGMRANDLAIRIKSCGYDISNIKIIKNKETAIDKFLSTKNKKYIITNYSPLIKTKEYLEMKEKKEK